MFHRSRQILKKNIVNRYYWAPNTNTNKNISGFIDYEKYVQDAAANDKQITDIHMYYKHLNNINAEQGRDIIKIKNSLFTLNQSINDQKYWIFHSVFLSYVGLFTYVFKL